MLCKYKNIFGEPKKGVHKYRFLNMAAVDLILTVFLAILISYYSKKNFIIVFFILIIISILVHKIFCVNTTLTDIF
jgi:succinate dehydrogenase hydrophobic anchor subunit